MKIAVVGGGIVGLAHAYMALKKGHGVVLFERDEFAVGASVRNFGLIWPIGQEPSKGLEVALRSREHWIEVAGEADFWMNHNGSLHLAYHDDEWSVLNEFYELYKNTPFQCELLSPSSVLAKSPVVKKDGLKGGLFSTTESTVYAREAVRRLSLWLQERFGLIVRTGEVVHEIDLPRITTSVGSHEVDKVFVCNGADFETLFPELFKKGLITKCKLQMMRASMRNAVDIGPTLCAGLTLRHYKAFSKCPSLANVDSRYDRENIQFKDHGIHVLLAQNSVGELIIGDSHHYGRTIEPFDDENINRIILAYLSSFTSLNDYNIIERWHGVYPKVIDQSNFIIEPMLGVTIVTGLGGAGMTLSFGIAEQMIDKL
jgi:D-hydroxyproline dehydrogenase subunit beta